MQCAALQKPLKNTDKDNYFIKHLCKKNNKMTGTCSHKVAKFRKE